MATIALVAAMHFVVSYASVLAGMLLWTLLGPLAVFVTGIADQGIPCLLLAMLLVLIPRVGVAAWSLATVFVLNTLFGGFAGVPSLAYIGVSIVVHETLLAASGITTTSLLRVPRPRPKVATVLRVALVLGLCKAVNVFAQFTLAKLLFRFMFADWYLISASLVTGLGYGSVGAAIGLVLGYRLRRVAV
ncbi:MAG TPA: hypothetical protein VHZ24_12050 [Pirellulales bacterium]|nr:hypothetical protein [Pirellulales bacterium]